MGCTDDAQARICDKLRMVLDDPGAFGALSCGERIAVALVLNRYDLIENTCGTLLEAVHRLGPHWTEAALCVQRNGWQ